MRFCVEYNGNGKSEGKSKSLQNMLKFNEYEEILWPMCGSRESIKNIHLMAVNSPRIT